MWAVVVLLCVAGSGWLYHRSGYFFRGRVVIEMGMQDLIAVDRTGDHKLGDMDHFPKVWNRLVGWHYPSEPRSIIPWSISVCPTGKTIAYTRPDDLEHHGVKRLQKIFIGGTDGWPLDPRCFRSTVRVLDVAKYRIPSPIMSNLEWSPSGGKLACADTNGTLFVIDAVTGEVATIPLPRDTTIDRLIALAPKMDLAYARSGYGRRHADSSSAPSPEKRAYLSLAEQDIDLMKQPRERIIRNLHLDRDTHIYAYVAAQVRNEEESMYGGRFIRWVAEDTIYCDNWKLKLHRDANGYMRATAEKTPLVSAPFARPYWSPKGDMAAYVVPLAKSGDVDGVDVRTQDAILVIVGASGKVLRQGRIKAEPCEYVRWSRDGRYLAVRWKIEAGYSYPVNYFTVYDVATLRSWTSRGVDTLDGNRWPAWDWYM